MRHPKNTFLLLLFLAIPLCSEAEAGNLLQNGDFEEELCHWKAPAWFVDALTAEWDSAVHQALGHGSLKFRGDGSKRGYILQQVKILPGGNRYHLSGWMKTDGFENSWSARIQVESVSIDVEQREQYQRWPLITPTALHSMDWQHFECSFSPPETARYLRVILLTQYPNHPSPNHGTVWFDNIELRKKPLE